MKLADYLHRDLIISDLSARTKSEVLAELVSPLGHRAPGLDLQRAAEVLMDRETLGTTGIGDGIAIPHGKMDCLAEVFVVVGRSQSGVDFASLDREPAFIFFMILAPANVAGLHLKLLAAISRRLKEEAFRQAFLAAPDEEGLWELLQTV